MADSVDQLIDAKVNAEVTKRIAALSQEITLLRPWITTKEVRDLTGWQGERTVIKKFADDSEVKRLDLVRKEGRDYFWKNPEFTRWLHDEYWRRNG